MNQGIVERNIQSEFRQVQFTDPGQQVIGEDDPVVLRNHQRSARIHQFLLRVEDVEGGALADPCFFAYAVERDLRARHLRLSRENLRLGRLQLSPYGGHVRLGSITCGVEIDSLLPDRLLGLANQRIFAATLVDRHAELAEHEGVELLQGLPGQVGFPLLLHRAGEI